MSPINKSYEIAVQSVVKTVSSAYAREHLPELLTAVSRRERVTIERHKRPVAELVPPSLPQRPAPKFGADKGKVKVIDPHWADPMTEEEVDALIEGR